MKSYFNFFFVKKQPEQQSTDEDSGPETKKVKTPDDEVDEDDVLEIEK